jgi:hypothetical protein
MSISVIGSPFLDLFVLAALLAILLRVQVGGEVLILGRTLLAMGIFTQYSNMGHKYLATAMIH